MSLIERQALAMKRVGVLLAAGFAVAVLLAACGGGSDKAGGSRARKQVVLTLANFLGDSTELAGFAGEVSRLSGGSMRIDVRSGWRLGQTTYEEGLIDDVRAGKADLGVVGSRVFDLVGVGSLRALTAPLLINNYALEQRVLSSPISAEMLRGIRRLGLVGLGVLPGPLRKPLGVARPLLRPADYARLRFGVQRSQLADATMRALGARPVFWPDEAGTAQINGFGGIEQQISTIQNYRFDGVGRYLTANVNLWPRPLVLFANRARFAKLTSAQQRILMRAAAVDARPEMGVVVANERYDTQTLCHRRRLLFLKASAADLVALRHAVQPVYNQLDRDPQTRRFMAEIEAMRNTVRPERAPDCARTTQVATKSGPLDGVYRYTVTATQLRAAHAAVVIPENYGTVTVVFDRGRFAQTQENKQACTWSYGTVAVSGSRLEKLTARGGGIARNRAFIKPGEFEVWRWSIYRDQLRVIQISPPGLAFPTLTWTRINTFPSARYFPKRCPPPPNALPGR